MLELGGVEHKCAASLAGLSPIAPDSGQRSSERCIRGGRAHLRQALYMPALGAVSFNAAMKTEYKVGAHAIMRELIILAHALIHDRRTWTSRFA